MSPSCGHDKAPGRAGQVTEVLWKRYNFAVHKLQAGETLIVKMSAFDNVVKLIKEWRPEAQPNELRYRDALTVVLRARLKDAQVEKEYRHTGTTIDIYVKQAGFWGSSEVFVELKRNLLQKTQLDRLVGQVESLRPEKNALIVVLCGETNPALETRFREKYRLTNELFPRPSFTLITKPCITLLTQQENGKRDYDALSEQLEDEWAKFTVKNVGSVNNYFPESFMAKFINVPVEVFRKVAAHMGDDRINSIRGSKGERVYRVVSGLPKARPRFTRI